MTDAYQVEFEITECTVKPGVGKQGPWKRHTLKGQDTPTYSGFSIGQNPVKGLADLKAGDYVTLQIQDDDTGKYHNIVKILDVGRMPPDKSVGEKAETTQKSTTTPNSQPQEIGMWWKEVGEMLRAKDIDVTTEQGKAIRVAYYKQMAKVLGLSIK